MREGDIEVLPLDEANRALLANTHPADWVNPEPAPRYNLVVIGTTLRQGNNKFLSPRNAALVEALRTPVLLIVR